MWFRKKDIRTVTDESEFFKLLQRRAYWKRLPVNFFELLKSRTNGELDKVKEFVAISEIHKCVTLNYMPICRRSKSTDWMLFQVGTTLMYLAEIGRKEYAKDDISEQEIQYALWTIQASYESAILVDPLNIVACLDYSGLLLNALKDVQKSKFYFDKLTLLLEKLEHSTESELEISGKTYKSLAADLQENQYYIDLKTSLSDHKLNP